MPSTYTPSAVALTTITLPADGDPRTAASVNSPFSSLANAIAYLTAHSSILQLIDVPGTAAPGGGSTAGTFIPPADCVAAIVEACGAGGSGGPGAKNGTTLVTTSTGGGGGSGAPKHVSIIPIVGGATHNYFVPGPTAPGAVYGGDTTVTYSATELFRARGGQSGYPGQIIPYAELHYDGGSNPARVLYGWVPGGPSPRVATSIETLTGNDPYPAILKNFSRQAGGKGITAVGRFNFGAAVNAGGGSPEGYDGGLGGNDGASLGWSPPAPPSTMGGGSGGGGGAGPYGVGGGGGNGSDATSGSPPTVGGNGSNAGTATGGGGGGGGGAGSGDFAYANTINGGTGGYGGSGHLRIWLLRLAP